MSIEEQVLSREQMAHLKELGVDTSDASLMWMYRKSIALGDLLSIAVNDRKYDTLKVSEDTTIHFSPTYTVNDIINKLPKQLYDEKSKLVINTVGGEEFYVWYGEVPETIKKSSSLLKALYDLLCWLSKNHKDLIK